MPDWFHLDSGPCPSAFNMAVDEALLESAARMNRPILRFYGWIEPATTFGYFQHIADIERLTALRPLIRRGTGGGIVPHNADWTYSAAFPPGHEWHGLKAEQSYERVHAWIRDAFSATGVMTTLAPEAHKTAPGQCFVGWEKSDLLWQGRKIAGAAQRRNRTGLMIQGSIQPPPGSPARDVWQQAMLAVARTQWGVTWSPFPQDDAFSNRARQLTLEKYGTDAYNRKR
jgi:lipoate-protein ligase A